MAMTFSSKGCTDAASSLRTSSTTLKILLENSLANTVNSVKNVYNSKSAEEIYAAFDKIKAKFPDFIDSVEACAKYLSDVVAPAYAKIESEASNKVGF